jgi:DNA-binding transcriptional LysR family regulator
MQRRYQHINVPTEIVRTVVAISELGSFSKAGTRLGLSQPAVSAQIKRLQTMVGDDIFVRSGAGVSMTPKGRLLLAHAKELLESNDQILSISGGENAAQAVRLGLSPSFIDQFLAGWHPGRVQVSIACDHSAALAKAFDDGYLDIVCLSNSRLDHSGAICFWEEDMVWVRSSDFVLQPGNPIPLIGWPGSPRDLAMTNTLEKAGLPYRFVLTSADLHVRTSAIASGLGITAFPLREVPEPLIIAEEPYLPALGPIKVGIFVRKNFDPSEVSTLIDVLKALEPVEREQRVPSGCRSHRSSGV